MSSFKVTEERVVPDEDNKDEKYCGHLIFYNFVSKYVKDKVILDDGCGTGYGSHFLTDFGPQTIVGLDRSPEAISYSTHKYQNSSLSYLVSDGSRLPLGDQLFDIVLSSQVIEHVPNYLEYLHEISRVLKSTGSLVIGTPNKLTFNPNGSPMPYHYKEFFANELVAVLTEYFAKVELLGQYNLKVSNKKTARSSLISFGQSEALSWISTSYRVKVGRKIAKIFQLNETYNISDFTIKQPFDASTSMNIICICSEKKQTGFE
jgi:ubiquinone/menaquinone biosynthesis C-methylase UbiE